MKPTVPASLCFSLLACLAACAPHPGFNPGFSPSAYGAPPAATPDGDSGVAMLNITGGVEQLRHVGFAGLKLIQMEHAPTAQGDMGRVLGYAVMSAPPDWAGGFVSTRLVRGYYVVAAFDVPYKGFCFAPSTLAFTIVPGKFTELGTLNSPAYLGRLMQAAAADTAARTQTRAALDGRDVFAANVSLDQSPEGLLPPTTADLDQARAYVDSKVGPGSDIVPAAYVPVNPPNVPRNGVDPCGTIPRSSANGALPFRGTTATSIDVEGMFPTANTNPYRNPGDLMKGLNFTPAAHSTTIYTFQLTDAVVYVDSSCHVTTKAEFFKPAGIPQNLFVQFTNYQGIDNLPWAQPHLRLFHRFSSDPPNCGFVISTP